VGATGVRDEVRGRLVMGVAERSEFRGARWIGVRSVVWGRRIGGGGGRLFKGGGLASEGGERAKRETEGRGGGGN